MKKQDLIDAISDSTSVDKSSVAKVIDALPVLLKQSLLSEGRVTIPGIGIATIKDRAARSGRNPQTGQPLTIEAKRVVTIKPTSTFQL